MRARSRALSRNWVHGDLISLVFSYPLRRHNYNCRMPLDAIYRTNTYLIHVRT